MGRSPSAPRVLNRGSGVLYTGVSGSRRFALRAVTAMSWRRQKCSWESIQCRRSASTFGAGRPACRVVAEGISLAAGTEALLKSSHTSIRAPAVLLTSLLAIRVRRASGGQVKHSGPLCYF